LDGPLLDKWFSRVDPTAPAFDMAREIPMFTEGSTLALFS
jgi:hypothetical protein